MSAHDGSCASSVRVRAAPYDPMVEEMEKNTRLVKTLDCDMQMITCEESIDLSYLENPLADLLTKHLPRNEIIMHMGRPRLPYD